MAEDYFSNRGHAMRVLINSLDDDNDEQYATTELFDGEKYEKVLRIQNFGLSSVPPADSHALAIALGGRRDSLLMVGGEHSGKRPKGLGAGNTALYNADGSIMKVIGKNMTIDAAGVMTITVTKFVIKATEIVLDGKVKLGGEQADLPVERGGASDTSPKVFSI